MLQLKNTEEEGLCRTYPLSLLNESGAVIDTEICLVQNSIIFPLYNSVSLQLFLASQETLRLNIALQISSQNTETL